MHELGITQDIVEIVSRRAAGASVRRVVVEIGKLSAVLPDAVRFCFDVCAEGTVVEGAELEIIELPGLGRCQDCGNELKLERPIGLCPCGSTRLEWVQGEELKIKEMEICDV